MSNYYFQKHQVASAIKFSQQRAGTNYELWGATKTVATLGISMVFPLQTKRMSIPLTFTILVCNSFPQGLLTKKRKLVLRDEKPPLISTVSDYSWMESLKSNTLGMGRSWRNGGDGWEVTLSDGRVYGGGRFRDADFLGRNQTIQKKANCWKLSMKDSDFFSGVKLKVVLSQATDHLDHQSRRYQILARKNIFKVCICSFF